MERRDALQLIASCGLPGCFSGFLGPAGEDSEKQRLQWVVDTLQEMRRIQPGMTRAELLQFFKTEGGLSTALERTYVSRRCPYFKVDVLFHAVGRLETDHEGRVTAVEDTRDEITQISRPYLALSVMD